MDFQKLKCVKERSARLENDARKQNDYQERRLNKYIVGIEKEHQGNMTMIKSHQKELKKKSVKLQDELDLLDHYVMPLVTESSLPMDAFGLPLIEKSAGQKPLYGESRGQFTEHQKPGGRRDKRNRTKAAAMWYKTTPVVIAAIRMLQRHGCNLSVADRAVLEENKEKERSVIMPEETKNSVPRTPLKSRENVKLPPL